MVRPLGRPVRLTKNGRAQIADRRAHIHIIEYISPDDADGQRIAAIRCASVRSAAAASAAPRTTGPASKRSAAHTAAPSAATGSAFDRGAKSKCFTNTQVHGKPPRPFTEIDGDRRSAWRRVRVKASEFRLVRRSASRKSWSRVEQIVLERICSGGDVERNSRACNHKRAQAETSWQANCSAQEKPVATVQTRAPILLLQIQRARPQTVYARSVAARGIVSVIAEEGELCSHLQAAVDDQLPLLEGSFRLILENVSLLRRR